MTESYPPHLPDHGEILCLQEKYFTSETQELIRGFVHPHYSINMHAHEFFELNLVLKGRGVQYIDKNIFLVEKGDMFIIPPGYMHGYYMLEDMDVYHLLLHRNFFTKYRHDLETLPGYIILFTIEPIFSRDMNFRYFLKFDNEALEQIMVYMTKISDIYVKRDIETTVLVNSLALHAVALICKLYREQYSIKNSVDDMNIYFSAITRCIEYINTYYTNRITLNDLLKVASMSRSTFMRVFYKATGYTPFNFINNYRINRARQLLAGSEKSIVEIANESGFYDNSHFDHIFKKHTGLTPKEYRYSFKPD